MARLKVIFGLIWLVPGVVFILIALPMARGEIAPNSLYGFRTVKTLSDPKIWYEINRVHGNDLIIAGIVMAMGAIVLLVVRKWLSLFKLIIMNLVIMFATLALVLAHTSWIMSNM